MDDHPRDFESGWHDVSVKMPADTVASRKRPRPLVTSVSASRHWYHARWIAFIIVLIAANGYAISSYLAAKAGQSDWNSEKIFATPHALGMPARHEKAGFRSSPRMRTQPISPAGAARIENTPRPKRVKPPDAAAVIALKCIAGVAYRVETRAGITSYTNDPAIRCSDG